MIEGSGELVEVVPPRRLARDISTLLVGMWGADVRFVCEARVVRRVLSSHPLRAPTAVLGLWYELWFGAFVTQCLIVYGTSHEGYDSKGK